MNTRHLLLPLALSLALAAPTAEALGLGQLQVKSGLNQPLVAEIPIISATPAEMDQLSVRLASPDAFARVGLDLPRELTANLQFSVGRNARGQSVVRITTINKFTEPFLSFLIEADWGKGTVTREYTALIDPPYIAPAVIRPLETATVAAAPMQIPVAPTVQAPPPAPIPTPAQTMAAAEPEPVTVQPAPEPVAEPLPPAPPPQPVVSRPAAPAPAPVRPVPRPAAPPAPAPTPVAEPAKPDQFGPVQKGKTLWSIAEQVKPDEALTTNQMMLALLRANPEAFDSENINRLKSGSVLRIPGREEVATLGPAEAAALVQAQASAWRTPPAPVPQPAEAIAERKPAEARPAAAASVETPAPAKPAVARRTPQSRLEIVPPSGKAAARGSQSGAAAGAGGSELRAELVQAKEDLAARTAEVTELKSRVADLDELNRKQEEMIQVQSSEMKALQDRLKELEQAKTATTTEPVAPPPAAQAAANVDKPAAKPTDKPVEEPASEPLYLNPYVLGGAGLLLLVGMVLALRKGRSAPAEDAPPPRRISDDEALRASLAQTRVAAVPAEPAPAAKPAPAPAPVKKAPEPKPAPAIDSELDNLKSAAKARPHDLEAHLSLLRYYHSHRQTAEYEAAAQIMRLQVPSTMDPRWREAVVMGAALLPGHPLFSQAGWNAPQFGEAAAAPAKATPEAPVAPVAAAAPAVAMAGSASAAVAEAHQADSNDWDRVVAQAGAAPENLADIDLSVPDFGVDTPKDVHRAEAEVLAEDEASATRIELAKAYLDIGDLEGARSMLEEVLIDGGPAAKAEALRILNELG